MAFHLLEAWQLGTGETGSDKFRHSMADTDLKQASHFKPTKSE